MACKLVINKDSGNCNKLNVEALLQYLGCEADVEFIDSNTDWSPGNYDTIVVCGGDGTLHNAIEKCKNQTLIYAPCGTLNETAYTESSLATIGKVNGESFSYVCATGSFTEIGYTAKNRNKKRWKSLAYLPQVFKSYKVHDISAKLDVDGKIFQGNYTLLMVLKSHRCFGFSFNKDYKNTKKNYLVAIKSCGCDNLLNRAKIFFPFFRIFFCGTMPKIAKNWLVLPFDNLTISLDSPQDFCFDGEKRVLSGDLHFSQYLLDTPIQVVDRAILRRKKCKKITVI